MIPCSSVCAVSTSIFKELLVIRQICKVTKYLVLTPLVLLALIILNSLWFCLSVKSVSYTEVEIMVSYDADWNN